MLFLSLVLPNLEPKLYVFSTSCDCKGLTKGSQGKGGTVVRVLASHQSGPGSNLGFDTICGLSLLLVLSLAPRGFSPGTPVFPSP